MILKNEAKSIRGVLEAALPYCDVGAIIDTGSDDGTQSIAIDAFVQANKPLVFVDEPFVDFAASRNRSLKLAAEQTQAVFSLVLSGDEYLQGGEELRRHLEEYRDKLVDDKTVDLHWLRLTIRGSNLYTPRVFRTGSAWRYEGVVHEVPYNREDSSAPMANVHGAIIEHAESDPEARLNNIWEVHIPLLRKELEKNPKDERALMFLAQSYECLMPGFDEEERLAYSAEAMELRRRRDAIPTGTPTERAYNLMHMIDDARLTGMFTDKELYRWASELYEVDPSRPETALIRAELAMKLEPLETVYRYFAHAAKVADEAKVLDNSSPVDASIEWRAHYNAAVAARQMSKADPAAESLIKEHVDAGLAAGGPWAVFRALVAPPEAA
jgi:hypothetical protein